MTFFFHVGVFIMFRWTIIVKPPYSHSRVCAWEQYTRLHNEYTSNRTLFYILLHFSLTIGRILTWIAACHYQKFHRILQYLASYRINWRVYLFLSYRYIAPSGITSITSTKYIVEDNYVILSYHNRQINKNLQSMNLPASAQTVQVAGRSHIADLLHTGNGVLARRFATE